MLFETDLQVGSQGTQASGVTGLIHRNVVGGQPLALRSQSNEPVQGAGIQQVVSQPGRHFFGQRALARGGRAVDAQHRNLSGSRLTNREQRLEIVGEGLAHTLGIFDPDRQSSRVEGSQREAHGHPVVIVGVDGRGFPVL